MEAAAGSSMEIPIEERDLVQRCQKGDRKAFEKLVRRYEERVFRTVYWMAGHYEEAKDLAQDVFVKAYVDIKKFKQKSSFFTWLNWIILDLCSRRFRSKKVRREKEHISLDKTISTEDDEVSLQISDGSANALEDIMKKERDRIIHDAIDSLKPKYRLALILCDIEALQYMEVSKIMKCSEGTVKSRLFRARQILKEKLNRFLP